MIRFCYLHVGTGKTGSSAIQYVLTEAHDRLRERGYDYPDAVGNFRQVLAGWPLSGNASHVLTLLRDGEIAGALQLVDRAASRMHLVLSNEGLANLHSAVLVPFVDGLKARGYAPKCLVFFRPQAEMIVSSYLQRVKTDKVRADLAEFAARYAAEKRLSGRWNWYARAEQLAVAFGEENTTVKWYPAVTRNEGVVQATFNWLGVPTLANDVARIVNPTPGREALIVLQSVNDRGQGSKRFADTFLAQAHTAGLLGSKVTLDRRNLEMISAATYKSNTALIERYCPELSASEELKLPLIDDEITIDRGKLRELESIASAILLRSADKEGSGKRNSVALHSSS